MSAEKSQILKKIRLGIAGYGNLGKGMENAVHKNNDMELKAVFTRRSPSLISSSAPVYGFDSIFQHKEEIDVMLLAGGSFSDLPEQGPLLASEFNTVDCYDNHSEMQDYFMKMDKAASGSNVSVIATGWDPGIFSVQRILAESVLPLGNSYVFWGKGLSQGHSDAARRVPGVLKAAQYTIPNETLIKEIKEGKNLRYTKNSAHKRLVFVVADEKFDKDKIRNEIMNMPDYYAPYETTVNFISDEEFEEKHTGMPHGGSVIRTGRTSDKNTAFSSFELKLESNPEYTGSVAAAYARAAYRMYKNGMRGAFTVADIPLAMISQRSRQEIISELI